MKLIALTFTVVITMAGFSQNEIKPSTVATTYEEYNFLTEQYGIEENATMLDGYELQNFVDMTLEKFNFNYKLFVELKTGNVKAVFITITKSKKKDDKVRYLCMPINNRILFNKFSLETEVLGISMSMSFEKLNKALFSKLIDEKFNSTPKTN